MAAGTFMAGALLGFFAGICVRALGSDDETRKSDQLLFSLKAELEQAKAELEQAKAGLEQARAKLEREGAELKRLAVELERAKEREKELNQLCLRLRPLPPDTGVNWDRYGGGSNSEMLNNWD